MLFEDFPDYRRHLISTYVSSADGGNTDCPGRYIDGLDTLQNHRQRLIGKIAQGIEAWARDLGVWRCAKAQHRRETDRRDLHRDDNIVQNGSCHQTLTRPGDPALVRSNSNFFRGVLSGLR